MMPTTDLALALSSPFSNWIRALKADPDFKPKQIAKGSLPYLGVLFKKSGDYERASAFVNRRKIF